MSMESLLRLTPVSGPGMAIPVRVVFTKMKEITPKSSGKPFTMFQAYVVDGKGHYTIVQRRIFGLDAQRKRVAGEMLKKFSDGSVWVMSKMTSVEINQAQYTCVSVKYVINYNNVGTLSVTAHFSPQQPTMEPYRHLPKIIEPHECLSDLQRLMQVVEKRTVNFMALLVSTEAPEGTPSNVLVKATLADWTGRVQVKFWGADWQRAFTDKEGQVLCGFGFWVSRAEVGVGLSQTSGATPRIRALSSVEGSHVMWPAEEDMPEGGKGRRLLREKDAIMASIQDCLTEDGWTAQGDNANYETSEACATVAALMELANRYYQPLPDSLFQLQGAYVTITASGPDGLCTKDPSSKQLLVIDNHTLAQVCVVAFGPAGCCSQ